MVTSTGGGRLHLLDTCVCIDLLRGRASRTALPASQCALSSISAAELWTGAEKMASPAKRAALQSLFEAIPILEFTSEAARSYGIIRTDLERRGISIGPLDLLIAAHALSIHATLVTANLGEFKRVPKLKCLAW